MGHALEAGSPRAVPMALLALSALLHAAALLLFAPADGARSGPPVSTVTVAWVLADPSPALAAAAAAAPVARTERTERTGRTVHAEPAPAAYRAASPARASEDRSTRPLPAVAPPLPASTEPEYRIAARSLAFGGQVARRDDAPPAAVVQPAVDVIHEGLARAVWSVAGAMAAAVDGHCDLALMHADDAAVALPGGMRAQCSDPRLAESLATVPAAALASLATWLRAGLVRAIELRFDAGRASYAAR